MLALRPDRAHPVSQGFACEKGLGFLRVHDAPERLRAPRVDGRAATWAEAEARVAQLGALRREGGPGAVGLYVGNAASQSTGAVLGVDALQKALGTRKLYTALSLDNACMFVVTEACFGNAMLTRVADYEHADLVVLFGTDPLSSQPSQAQSNPQGVRHLLRLGARGGLVVVDPRRSTTARHGAHLAPRPGSDVALLAWLARSAAERVGNEAVAAALDAWTLDRATHDTALPADSLVALDARIAAAERPLVWSGLGVLLGAHGTLGYWLTLVLQSLLGLDRPGGWHLQPGPDRLAAWWRWVGPRGYDPDNRSRVGGFPAVLGTHAAATLADDILTPGPDRLRALVVVGGNPAVSAPDPARMAEALRRLDLLVVLDLLPSATTALAHVVLPVADWLEREERGTLLQHTRPFATRERSPAVVPPPEGCREDWDALGFVARAAGLPRYGSWAAELGLRATGFRPAHLGAALAWMPRPPLTVPPPHLLVPAFVEALGRVPPLAPGTRLVTSVRPVGRMNSWIGAPAAVAQAPAADVARWGGRVRIRSDGGEVELPVEAAELPADTLVVPWCAEANQLVSRTALESFVGSPVSNGTVVRVTGDEPPPAKGTGG